MSTNAPPEKLPDLLADDLALVFVGTAASNRSAALGAYYAHPGNRFWTALFEAGITPRRYEPAQFRELSRLGIGFTDLCKYAAGMDHRIGAADFDVAAFEAKIRRHRPRVIAFTSKKAASLFYGCRTGQLAVGRHQPRQDFPDVFVLPSPSGAASRYWDIAPWRELAKHAATHR